MLKISFQNCKNLPLNHRKCNVSLFKKQNIEMFLFSDFSKAIPSSFQFTKRKFCPGNCLAVVIDHWSRQFLGVLWVETIWAQFCSSHFHPLYQFDKFSFTMIHVHQLLHIFAHIPNFHSIVSNSFTW